jgi:hypothetical protein
MNRVLAFEVCAALWEDHEFAARLRAQPSDHGELVASYFTDRGVDEGDALILVAAYLAGTEHMLLWAGRVIDRQSAHLLREETVRGLAREWPWRPK